MNNDFRVTAPRVRMGSGQQLTALSPNFKITVSQFPRRRRRAARTTRYDVRVSPTVSNI